MGRWIEQTILKKSTNGQQIHEEMFNMSGHQGNANQNDWDFISPLSGQLTSRKQTTTKAGSDMGKKEPLQTVVRNVN
jgi:hypothetical protein